MTYDARLHRRAALAGLVSLTTLLSSACPETDAQGAGDGSLDASSADGGTGQGGRDAAASASGDGGTGGGEEPESCGYWVTVRSGCSGDSSYRKTAYGVRCIEGISVAECRSNVPEDNDTEDSTCFRSETHDYWMFAGDCDDWDAYWNDEVDCLIDDQCGAGNACLNQTCYCGDEPCGGSVSAPTTGDGGSDGGANPDGGVVTVGGDGGPMGTGDAAVVTTPEGGVTTGGSSGGSTTGDPDGGFTTPDAGATSGGSSGGSSGTTPGGPDGGVTTPGGGFTTP